MIVSEARRAANIMNSSKSTGPRDTTRSRSNALKHGLTAKVLEIGNLSASIPTLEGEANAGWLADQITLAQSRIELCGKMEIQARERIVFRAKNAWEDDRRAEADILGSGIANNPARVLAKLRQTVQGCQHLLERWVRMAGLALRPRKWTDEQTSVIFDLLGVPKCDRPKITTPDKYYLNLLGCPFQDCPALARDQIVKLKARIEELKSRDAFDRSEAESGNSEGVEVRRYRRYESALYSRLKWCLKQLNAVDETKPTEPAPDAETKPSEPEAEPEVAPERSQSPPVSDRIAAREAKAEANRAAKLRKLGRRRA